MSDWRHQAECQVEDPEVFFPIGTAGPALLQIAEAKTVCRRCPVITECLTWALVMWIFIRDLPIDLRFSVVDMSMTLARPVMPGLRSALAGRGPSPSPLTI